MAPTLTAGQEVVAIRKWRPVRPGDIVLVGDPREPSRTIVKRCVMRRGRLLDLRGDNAEASTDSRSFGLVPARAVHYIVMT